MTTDSDTNTQTTYQKRKNFFDGLLTIYGRLAVKESMMHPDTRPHRLHLARSNSKAQVIDDIVRLAEEQGAEICYHSREQLARISKNGKQDQGVAVDLVCSSFKDYLAFPAATETFELLALDRITNSRNLGMIIRSVSASPLQGMILPAKGCAKLDPLVVKASAGNLFKCKIYRCNELDECLSYFKEQRGCRIVGLSSQAPMHIGEMSVEGQGSNNKGGNIFVLGNESTGMSANITQLCDLFVSIPMKNQVESLNVAVAASLIAYRSIFSTD